MLRSLERKKEPGRRFNTLIFKTAIAHLERYLREVHGEDWINGKSVLFGELKYDTPLFLRREGKRHAGSRFSEMMRKIAPDSEIAGTRQEAADLNPLRPHALRASFSDQMAKAGASKILVDYLMGHKLSYDDAYFGGEEGLRESYARYAEAALEPRQIKPATELVDSIEKQSIVVSNLAAEVKKIRQENTELVKFKESIERRLSQFEKAEQYIRSMQKQMKFHKEGGAVISYTDEISKEELGELIRELKERHRRKDE
jgi:hypothetical protein